MWLYEDHSGGRGIFQYQIHLSNTYIPPTIKLHNVLYDYDSTEARFVEKNSSNKTVQMSSV